MEKAFDKIWSNCLEIIKDIVEWQHFKTWFEPIKPVALKEKSFNYTGAQPVFL